MNIFKCLLTVVILFSASSAMAFDDDRDGFFMGFGIGVHSLNNDYFFYDSKMQTDSKNGLATSFKIGYGFTEQVALYYIRNASWFNDSYSEGYSTSDTLYTIGMGGLGITYYFSSSAPSAYLMLASGVGDISAPLESNATSDTGCANLFGVGYEFSKHVTSELTLLKADIESSYDSRLRLESTSLQLTINYVFY